MGAASFKKRRILVVEDDYMMAQDLCEELELLGADVMGPVATVSGALELLEAGPPPSVAVLDIKLADDLVYPVADALRGRGIPFIFATGYDLFNIPKAYAGVPVAEKPIFWQEPSRYR